MEILINECKLFRLEKNIYTFGRNMSCDIRIEDKTVSRTHATLFLNESLSWLIIDGDANDNQSKSKNGISLNGQKINDFAKLKNGDIIRLSKNFHFKFFEELINKKDEKSTMELLV